MQPNKVIVCLETGECTWLGEYTEQCVFEELVVFWWGAHFCQVSWGHLPLYSVRLESCLRTRRKQRDQSQDGCSSELAGAWGFDEQPRRSRGLPSAVRLNSAVTFP